MLPGGFDAKCTVDSAIACCGPQIGNLLADVRKCHMQTGKLGAASGPAAMPVGPGDAEGGAAAKKLLPAAGEDAVASSVTGSEAAGAAVAAAAAEADQIKKKAAEEEEAERQRKKKAEDAGGSAAAAALTSKGADTLQFAARQLGVHYLKRYFLLICYRCERVGV